jgi:hypothetical protein
MKETEYKDQKLGTAINDSDELLIMRVDHIEKNSDEALKFEFGWIPKQLISRLIWEETFKGVFQVVEIELPKWWADKNI